MTDSGQGFKRDASEPSKLANEDKRSYGRGIALIESLCSSVTYNQVGNEITVLIKLK